jgi:hypothetical protein
MAYSRSQRIVNLLSAIMVLLAGFYVIIFLPLRISPLARIIIGIFLILYFLLRLKLYMNKYKETRE